MKKIFFSRFMGLKVMAVLSGRKILMYSLNKIQSTNLPNRFTQIKNAIKASIKLFLNNIQSLSKFIQKNSKT